jgi:PAS domain S-box-containing protein
MLGYEEHEIAAVFDEVARLLHPEDKARVVEYLDDYLAGRRAAYEIEFRLLQKNGDYRWVLARGEALRDTDGRPYRMAGSHTDITERKLAERELERLNRKLLTTSRRAGMAEVATGVLHNVGNVLNSVNVSATLIADRVGQQKIPQLAKAIALLNDHLGDASYFLTQDPKGKVVPSYLKDLADHLLTEQVGNLAELATLTTNIEHIKEIVAMQQSYAKVSGTMGAFDLADIVEDALKINIAGFVRHRVRIIRDFVPTPPVFVDRHKTLQIVVNLLGNAKYAVDAATIADKQITVQILPQGPDTAQVIVRDNGIGIAKEHLIKIFNHGYTTRKEGHGFGLHSGANSAKEMHGSLTAASEGPGRGASFTLELPLAQASVPKMASGAA